MVSFTPRTAKDSAASSSRRGKVFHSRKRQAPRESSARPGGGGFDTGPLPPFRIGGITPTREEDEEEEEEEEEEKEEREKKKMSGGDWALVQVLIG